MTNYEYYKERIEEILNENEKNIFAIINNTPYQCKEINYDCGRCENKCSISKTIEWGLKEYHEPSISITTKQKLFLKTLGKGYLARGTFGTFSYFRTEQDHAYVINNIESIVGKFDFIKENNVLWSVEEILRMGKNKRYLKENKSEEF